MKMLKTLAGTLLFRSTVAFSVVMSAILSTPQTAAASGPCGEICLYYCPSDPWSYCRVTFGPTCGVVATCTYDATCGWVKLTCYFGSPD